MSEIYYDGTSAYKIEQYNSYTDTVQKKHEEKLERQNIQKLAVRKKLTVIISAVFAVAIAFLYLNVMLLQASATYSRATAELEDVKMRNAQLAFDIASGVDLKLVETKAKTEFGMQRPESHQNVYVDVVQSDYVETFNPKESNMGLVERAVMSFKSFLAYIG